MLKLFLMEIELEILDNIEEELLLCISSWTPKSLSDDPPTKVVVVVGLKFEQVLELWPMFPQCEHFLPIFLKTNK